MLSITLGTCTWFLEQRHYIDWQVQPNSVLWLSGFSGSGKSVLCSTAVCQILQGIKPDSGRATAFFYFDTSNLAMRSCDSLLRSLNWQLHRQYKGTPDRIWRLTHHHGFNEAPSYLLSEILKIQLQQFKEVYLIVDALDECSDRTKLLSKLEEIKAWDFAHIHLLVTSQDEASIREGLRSLAPREITCQSLEVQEDIRRYINESIRSRYALRKWKDQHELIRSSLQGGAQGM